MAHYLIKKPDELTVSEIKCILEAWSVSEWLQLDADNFRKQFRHSEFHLLRDDTQKMVCLTRINRNFTVQFANTTYTIPELVGLVSLQERKGYAKQLLNEVVANLNSRNLECVGFCAKDVRTFYEKSGILIYYNQAKFLMEKENDVPDPEMDDDILAVCLSAETAVLFQKLSSASPAYIVN